MFQPKGAGHLSRPTGWPRKLLQKQGLSAGWVQVRVAFGEGIVAQVHGMLITNPEILSTWPLHP